jgi:hypothetical protein
MLKPTNHSCKEPTAKHSQEIVTEESRRDSRWGEASEKKESAPDFLKTTKERSSYASCQNSSSRCQIDPPPVIAPKEESGRPIWDSTPTPCFINEEVGSSMAIEHRVPVSTADGTRMTLVFNELDGSVHVIPCFTPGVLSGRSIPSIASEDTSTLSKEKSSHETKSRKEKKKKKKTETKDKHKDKKKQKRKEEAIGSKHTKTSKTTKKESTRGKSEDSREKTKEKKVKKKGKSERDDSLSLLAKKLRAMEERGKNKDKDKKSKSKESKRHSAKRSDDDGDTKKHKQEKKKKGGEEDHKSSIISPYKNPSNSSISTISTDETSSCYTFDERKAMSLIRELQVFARQLG